MFKKKLQDFEKVLALITVFLIPTQLALHFWPPYSFVFGLRVDYLSPAIYLTDVLIVGLLTTWFWNGRQQLFKFLKKQSLNILILLILIFINTYFSSNAWISFWKWLKVIEVLLFAFYIKDRKEFLGELNIFRSLFFSAVLFSLIGIFQFLLGKTTGFFYFFGERNFSMFTPGIALTKISGISFLRAYSTFSHPNSLAGFLGVVVILIFGSGLVVKNRYYFLGLIIILGCLFLTFSQTAFVVFLLILFLLLLRKNERLLTQKLKYLICLLVFVSLVFPLFSGQKFLHQNISKNLIERLDLATISGRIISKNFLVGSGINTFITNIPKYGNGLTYSWLLQPVHNIYLLVFAETGLIGILFFLAGIYKVFRKLSQNKKIYLLLAFVFILFTGTMDHYWLTIQQNILLISLLLGFI